VQGPSNEKIPTEPSINVFTSPFSCDEAERVTPVVEDSTTPDIPDSHSSKNRVTTNRPSWITSAVVDELVPNLLMEFQPSEQGETAETASATVYVATAGETAGNQLVILFRKSLTTSTEELSVSRNIYPSRHRERDSRDVQPYIASAWAPIATGPGTR